MNTPSIELEANAQPDTTLTFTSPVVVNAAADAGDAPATFDAAPAYSGGRLPGYTAKLPHDVVVDLAGMTQNRSVLVNLDHNKQQRVGHATAITNDGKTVAIAGSLSASTAYRDEVRNSSKDGLPWEVSVEVTLSKLQKIAAGQTITVNGQSFTGPLFVARASLLHGLAFTGSGADPGNNVRIAASAVTHLGAEEMEFNAWLTAKGFDPATITDSQKTYLQASWQAEQQPTPKLPADSEFAQMRAAQQRRNQLEATALKYAQEMPDIGDEIERQLAAALDNDGITHQAFELAVLRASRPMAQPRVAGRGAENDSTVLEAALCQMTKVANIEDHFSEQTLEAAHKHFRHGLSIGELLLRAARQRGYHGWNISDVRGVLEHAFDAPGTRPLQASGFSTINVPGILSSYANKVVHQYFHAVEQAWRKVTAIRPVKDFKETKGFALVGDFDYKEIGKDGEIKHAVPGEVEYGNRAQLFGRMLGVGYVDLVNDDTGALHNAPKRLGRGGATKLNQVFWTEWQADPSTFYTVGRGNYLAGAGTAFGEAAITTMDTLFRPQKDPDNQPLGSIPWALVVPTALRVPARKLVNSTATSQNDKEGNNNPWSGMFEVVDSSYLTSAKAYWMISHPDDLPVMETVFLNGQELPTVESAAADFDQLGILFRGIHAFGCRKQEYRGGVKYKGEV